MHRIGQFIGHLTARVSRDDLQLAHGLLPPTTWPLFDVMPVADQRHGVDVATRLLSQGHDDPELLAAALLHDAAKGHRMRVWHRVGGVVLEALAPRLLQRLASDQPAAWGYPFHLYLHHADLSAAAAREAGCTERTARFIRDVPAPQDGPMAAALRAADEAS